ncbi:hypothetical protein [Intrasporangium sp.]|uniref:hypothetical protein n=1 Tax=Intrasporangium sp. TaxID=1925024 RepID=UPI003221D18A
MSGNGGTLDTFGVLSSAGLRMSQYQLSLDPQTNALGFSFNAVFVGMTQFLWWVYRFVCAFLVWVVNMAAGFGWLGFIRDGLTVIATPIQAMIAEVGLVPLMTAVAALVAGFLLVTGRVGSGLTEMATSATIAALFAGVLANPIRFVTGPDGILLQARDLGLSAAASIGTEDTGGKALPGAAGARLVDLFVDLPAQLINFGKPLSAQCVKVWHDALAAGPRGDDAPWVRQVVAGCDSAAQAVDGITALGTGIVLSPSTVSLLCIAFVIAIGLLLLGVIAVKDTVKLLFYTPRAIAPGEGRTEFFRCLTSAAMCAFGILMLLILLTIQLELLELVFTNAVKPAAQGGGGYNPILAFFLTDLLLVIGGVMLLTHLARNRKKARAAAERLAKKTTGATGSQRPSMLTAARRGVATVSQLKLTRAAAGLAAGPAAAAAVGAVGAAAAPGQHAPPGHPPRRVEQLRTAARVTGAVGGAAAKLAWGTTLGAPVSVPRWTRAGKAAATQTTEALREKISASRQAATDRVVRRVAAAGAYRDEYTHNLAAAARFAGRATGKRTTPPTQPDTPATPHGPAGFTHQQPPADPFEKGRTSRPGVPAPTPPPATSPSRPPRPGPLPPGSPAAGEPHPAEAPGPQREPGDRVKARLNANPPRRPPGSLP